MSRLVLASASIARASMLAAAGVPFVAAPVMVDEDAAKAALRADGRDARDIADALAELKAIKGSMRDPGALVLGCDSTVELEDSTLLDKPVDRADAEAHLGRLSGRRHRLHSAAVIAEGGRATWRQVETASLVVRPLSDSFIASYLDTEWPAISGCVGCYRIEGPGVQLFERVEGSHFTILGLPLLALLGHLRTRGVMAA